MEWWNSGICNVELWKMKYEPWKYGMMRNESLRNDVWTHRNMNYWEMTYREMINGKWKRKNGNENENEYWEIGKWKITC